MTATHAFIDDGEGWCAAIDEFDEICDMSRDAHSAAANRKVVDTAGPLTLAKEAGEVWANPGEPTLVAQVGWVSDGAFIIAANPEIVTRLCREIERLRSEESR